ncbi:DeoR/GlpR family DNA-binding transcription regulator [Brevibacillus sp. B_LB10_24]|uniref:DeoR/GlpR family DNA-binding transcription regulator n=1 Tax=Brevibacillus sp. B_LB10_24 TaxID=3380645 RepID=UPI0038B7A7E0
MSLVGEERKEIILDMLNLAGKVRTNELTQRLQVSAETIRRYLEELENEQKLKRVYGGAIKITYDREEPTHLKREITRAEEKKRIGRAAANLVQDNDVIVIDDGTTTLHMIEYLVNKINLTVITCSVPVLSLLMEYQNKGLFSGEIYFVGGKVQSKYFRVAGSLAEKMVSGFYMDKAFIAADGILMRKGITSYNLERSLLVQKYIENANVSIVMADQSKIGIHTPYKIADMKDIDMIISDEAPPREWTAELEAKDINWIVAD